VQSSPILCVFLLLILPNNRPIVKSQFVFVAASSLMLFVLQLDAVSEDVLHF